MDSFSMIMAKYPEADAADVADFVENLESTQLDEIELYRKWEAHVNKA
jgi:hypothetical protein